MRPWRLNRNSKTRNSPNPASRQEDDARRFGGAYVLDEAGSDFIALSGIELLCYPMLVLGGRGHLSCVANFAPRPVAELYDAFIAGDHERARNSRAIAQPDSHRDDPQHACQRGRGGDHKKHDLPHPDRIFPEFGQRCLSLMYSCAASSWPDRPLLSLPSMPLC